MSDPSLKAFLDSGTSFQGKVSFQGLVRIDGHFSGEVSADGTLVVGETGRVEARLDVGSLVVYGTVIGDIAARERVEVGATGVVEGTVMAPRLQMDEGSRLNAKIQMTGTPMAIPNPQAKAE